MTPSSHRPLLKLVTVPPERPKRADLSSARADLSESKRTRAVLLQDFHELIQMVPRISNRAKMATWNESGEERSDERVQCEFRVFSPSEFALASLVTHCNCHQGWDDVLHVQLYGVESCVGDLVKRGERVETSNRPRRQIPKQSSYVLKAERDPK